MNAKMFSFHPLRFTTNGTIGSNILCMNPLELRKVYAELFSQSANLSTFMQMDSITVDFGYVINTGKTLDLGKA